MDCPNCKESDYTVLEVRAVIGNATRRRKNCKKCGTRWTTYERCEPVNVDLNFNNRGSKNHNSVLNEDNVRQMRIQHSQGKTYAAISKKYGVSYATASRIVRRLSWTHVI